MMVKNADHARKKMHEKTYANSGDKAIADLFVKSFGGGKYCLDVGCGAGGNAALLLKNGWTVDGITISANEASIASLACGEIWIHNLETGLPKTIKPETYDVILASHVLEHIFYPDQLLSDCWRSLKPGGGFVVVLPNLLYWKNRVKIALGRFDYQNVGIMDYTHCRWYTLKTAKALLNNSGFEVTMVVADGQFIGGKLRRLFPDKAMQYMDFLFQRIAPGLAAFQMYFVAKKKT